MNEQIAVCKQRDLQNMSSTNSCKRLVRLTYDGGIAPVKKFWSRYKTRSDVKFAKPGGKSPERKLFRKSLFHCNQF